MSCGATPAHASEAFEWRIRQRSRGLTCGSRASRRRRTALLTPITLSYKNIKPHKYSVGKLIYYIVTKIKCFLYNRLVFV